MVLARTEFKYKDRVLIEKVKIRPPFRLKSILQDTGCFVYSKECDLQLLSSECNTKLKCKEGAILQCGNYMIDISKEKEQIEVFEMHLYPEVLKDLYKIDLPVGKSQQKDHAKKPIIASNILIVKFIDSLEFYFENPLLVNDDLLELKIKELMLLFIHTKHINSVGALVGNLTSTKSVKVEKVVDLHLYTNLKVEELAKFCKLSVPEFEKAFKKEFEMSPTDYITEKKIEKAKELLNFTKLSIKEITKKVGFSDILSFTKLFKKKTNIAPTSFRLTTGQK